MAVQTGGRTSYAAQRGGRHQHRPTKRPRGLCCVGVGGTHPGAKGV
jgi:hypothetical protein